MPFHFRQWRGITSLQKQKKKYVKKIKNLGAYDDCSFLEYQGAIKSETWGQCPWPRTCMIENRVINQRFLWSLSLRNYSRWNQTFARHMLCAGTVLSPYMYLTRSHQNSENWKCVAVLRFGIARESWQCTSGGPNKGNVHKQVCRSIGKDGSFGSFRLSLSMVVNHKNKSHFTCSCTVPVQHMKICVRREWYSEDSLRSRESCIAALGLATVVKKGKPLKTYRI
jgi:hypothetical protein